MKIYLRINRGKLSSENEFKGKSRKNSIMLIYYDGASKKRNYENLKLFLYDKPKNNLEKDHNKETLKLAETIKAKRILDAQMSSHGFISQVRSNIGFLAFFKKLSENRFDSRGNHGNWDSTLKHLETFMGGCDIPIGSIDEKFLEKFKDYLSTCKTMKGIGLRKLNPNSALSYFNKVKAALKEAYMNKIIKENPSSRVKSVKGVETHREFLTLEELQKLAKTECELPLMKKAFLFSALTGLRFSDVKAMRWDNIKYSETDGWYLQYTQKKTKGAEILPIPQQAVNLLGERKDSCGEIFDGLDYSAWNNILLRNWVEKAGITKKITFHCARHSFATLQLSMNTDIYTVSKLLGHRHLKTTEIYAKVIDKKKIEAASKIPMLM